MKQQPGSVRTRRGRRRHALDPSAARLMCGRPSTGLVVDDAFPDCAGCLRAIARATREAP